MTDNQRRRPPPELLAAAAQDYQAARERVALAVEGARLIALDRGDEIETFAEAYYVLSRTSRDLAAAIGAAAIVQLANSHNRYLN